MMVKGFSVVLLCLAVVAFVVWDDSSVDSREIVPQLASAMATTNSMLIRSNLRQTRNLVRRTRKPSPYTRRNFQVRADAGDTSPGRHEVNIQFRVYHIAECGEKVMVVGQVHSGSGIQRMVYAWNGARVISGKVP